MDGKNKKLPAHVAHGSHVGAGMRANDGGKVVDAYCCLRIERLHLAFELFSDVLCISVNDIDHITGLSVIAFAEKADELAGGSLVAAFLIVGGQLALFVDLKDGLDVKQGTHSGGSSADTATALEIHQVLHHEPMADVLRGIYHISSVILQGHAGVKVAQSTLDQHTHTAGGAEGIHRDEIHIGIILLQHLLRHLSGLESGAQTAAQAEIKHRGACSQSGGYRLGVLDRGDLGSLGQISIALTIIEGFEVLRTVGAGAHTHGIANRIFHRDEVNASCGFIGNVSGDIHENFVFAHISISSGLKNNVEKSTDETLLFYYRKNGLSIGGLEKQLCTTAKEIYKKRKSF